MLIKVNGKTIFEERNDFAPTVFQKVNSKDLPAFWYREMSALCLKTQKHGQITGDSLISVSTM